MIQVSLVLGPGVVDPAELAAVRQRLGYPQLGLDLVFGGVRQLPPPGPKNLIPLSLAGLWLAEMTTPKAAPSAPVR